MKQVLLLTILFALLIPGMSTLLRRGRHHDVFDRKERHATKTKSSNSKQSIGKGSAQSPNSDLSLSMAHKKKCGRKMGTRKWKSCLSDATSEDPASNPVAAPTVKPSQLPTSSPSLQLVSGTPPPVLSLAAPSFSPTSQSSSMPSQTPSAKVTLMTRLKCFETTNELYQAVDAYMIDSSDASEVVQTYGIIEEWCVDKLSNFRAVFSAARNSALSAFDADLSKWNMRQATTFSGMFQKASSYTGKGIGSWVTSSLTDTSAMFDGASSFSGLVSSLSSWDTSRVTTMKEMFRDAPLFNGDLSSWQVHNVKDMTQMFAGAFVSTGQAFNSKSIEDWDVSQVTSMVQM